MEEEIQKALEVLRKGGTLLYPTETVWGIGCDATNQKAVERIFEIKKRSASKSLVVLVDSETMLNRYVNEVPAVAWELLEMSDKPLTIVYDDVRGLATNVTSEDHTAAIRVTSDAFCKRLIHKFGRPIVSSSANISDERTPSRFDEINPEICATVDHIVNWRQDDITKVKPSTIIKVRNNGEVTIIRP